MRLIRLLLSKLDCCEYKKRKTGVLVKWNFIVMVTLETMARIRYGLQDFLFEKQLIQVSMLLSIV